MSEKRERRLLFFFCCFLIGLTAGSVVGPGSGEAELEFGGEISAKRYILSAFATNLPFWLCLFLPRSLTAQFFAAAAALAAKGGLIGWTSVYILINSENKVHIYAANIFPQLVCATLLLAGAALILKREQAPNNYSTILTNIFLSILATFFVSCVQFLFFFIFTQVN